MNSYKIVLVGESNSGKSAFINRISNGTFTNEYVPTMGVEVRPLVFQTNYGEITFNVWDTAGQKRFMGLGDKYYVGVDAFLSFSCDNSFINPIKNGWDTYSSKKPCVVNVLTKQDNSSLPNSISTKMNRNLLMPFVQVARILTKHDDLIFV